MEQTETQKAARLMGLKGGATRKKQLGTKGYSEMGKAGAIKKALIKQAKLENERNESQ